MSYVLAFLGFSALILLHEAGHFAAAKAVGMRVERFSLFFGPLLLKVRRGETEYGIAPIPLGGYVKISGMNPREELPPEVVPRAYYNQPVWKRIFVILAGPAVNLAIAFIIVWALFVANGQAVATKQIGAVEKTSQAAGLLKPGDKLVSVDGVTGSSDELRAQLATHRCAGAQVNGCLAQTPARIVVQRNGNLADVQHQASLQRSRQAAAGRVLVHRRAGVGGSRPRRRAHRIGPVARDHLDRVGDRADLRAPGAQAAQRDRGRLYGDPGVVRREHHAGALGPGA